MKKYLQRKSMNIYFLSIFFCSWKYINVRCIPTSNHATWNAYTTQITWIDGSENVLTAGVEYVKEPSLDMRLFTAKSILKLKANKEHHNKTIACQAQNGAEKTYRSTSIRLEVRMDIPTQLDEKIIRYWNMFSRWIDARSCKTANVKKTRKESRLNTHSMGCLFNKLKINQNVGKMNYCCWIEWIRYVR